MRERRFAILGERGFVQIGRWARPRKTSFATKQDRPRRIEHGLGIEGAAGIDDDLRKLPRFIALSRRTSQVLWQNISLALGIKALFFALALASKATLWMAVFADMGASLLVVGNGLRLLNAAGSKAEA